MDFRILGPIEVIDGDRPLALGGARQRALLGMLLLHAGEVVSSDRLIDELWPGERREDASGALQVAVSRLRKSLRPAHEGATAGRLLVTRPPGYELLVEPESIDARRFEALAERGRRALADGAPRDARELLGEALALWRGAPLADLAYESFCQAEIGRLDELRLAALEEWVAAGLELGEHSELVGRLRVLVDEQPLRERSWAQLMLALYRSGRQAEALDAYAEARATLVEELGIEPGRELRELQQAILEHDPGLDLELPPASQAVATPSPGRGAFVGRDPELAELLGGLEDVLSGQGRLFLLAGEPGIGKSRLAEELTAHAVARGAQVLVGRCWEAGGAPAYWPWVQSLRGYVHELDDEALERRLGAAGPALAQLLPELRERLPALPELPALDPVGARFRLFEAVAELLRRASEEAPAVLMLDDLHAADAPSLLLLQFLARELGASRVLLIGAYRDVDPLPSETLAATLAELAREPVTRRLALTGLSASEVESYVDQTASEVGSPELVAELHRETEGNPLFVGEMVRLLSAADPLAAPATEGRLAVPQTVHDVIAHRLGHLSASCRDVLVPASALGREFSLAALARMAELSEDDLLELLDEAMSARVVAELPGTAGRLRFAHVLIRDSLYDRLTQARRLRLHRSAVEAFEALYGDDPGGHLTELAHHAAAGGDPVKGLDYAERAGDRALAGLAYEEAARLYTGALELVGPDERRRCRLLLALGEAHVRAGNTPRAKETFLEAADVARRLGLGHELGRAAAGYGGRIVWGRAGDDERLVPLLEAGLEALPEEDVELRVRLLARLAGALRDDPSRDRRDALSASAVEVARRSGNDAALAYALDGRVAVIVGPDTVPECFELATELIGVAERVGDRERVVQGRCSRMIARLQQGDASGTELDLEAATRLATELRQPAHLWQVSGVRAMLALAAGDLAVAARLVPETFAYGQPVVGRAAASVYWLQRLTLSELRGEDLEEYAAPLTGLAADHPARTMFRCALAYVHARSGRRADASRALAELTCDGCAALPFDQEWTFGMSLLAEACALLEEPEPARVLYERLLPWSALNVVDQAEGIRGSAARYLGLLAVTLGRWAEAESHFDDALAANAAMGLDPWTARTRDDRERMLRA